MYPTTSSSFDVRLKELEMVINQVYKNSSHNDLIYFIFPASLTKNFTKAVVSKKLECRFSVKLYVFSHISTEAIPKFDWTLDFMKEVGLNVVRLKTGKQDELKDLEPGYFDASYEPSVAELYANSIRVF